MQRRRRDLNGVFNAADVNDSIDQQAVVSLSPGGRVTTEEELSPVELAVPLQGPHTLTSQTGLETPPPWRHHPARPAWRAGDIPFSFLY